MAPEQLAEVVRIWRRRLIAREVLLIGAATVVVAAVAVTWTDVRLVLSAAGATFAIAFLVRLTTSRQWRLDAPRFAQHLDRAFPELEESSALWLRRPESLNVVERLQRERIDRAAPALQHARGDRRLGAPPSGLLRIPLLCAGAALVLFSAIAARRSLQSGRLLKPAPPATAMDEAAPAVQPAAAKAPPTMLRAEMLISPPPYTGRPERRVAGLNAEVEEGATVSWTLTFDQPLTNAQLTFGASEAIPMQLADGSLRATRVIQESALYQPSAVLQDGAAWTSPELYSVQVIKDQPPTLRILQPTLPRTVVDPVASPNDTKVSIDVETKDDYGTADAHLIATVAKGTGEAVKFREQQIAFDDAEGTSTDRHFTKSLDLAALGLEPGDELYFYVAAHDAREPENNHARSETRFIVIKGPDQDVSTPGAGVAGVNLVPQYFRSQRQIIIDTEKLIAERETSPEQEFNRRSNDLGVDQQLLRQRYGQFLGQDEHFEGDGHDHSTPPANLKPSTVEEVAAQFGHRHDSQDEATLFQGEAKASMRDALAAMWEAEGLLRTNRPAEALAPENRALEILKALQQSDRAYVQRVGFEAAPIQIAERRLRGDATAVPERAVARAAAPADDDAAAALRAILQSTWWQDACPPSRDEAEIAGRVEPILTNAATNDPAHYLDAVRLFRRRTGGEIVPTEEAAQIERAMLRLVGAAKPRPSRSGETSPLLAERYFEKLAPDR